MVRLDVWSVQHPQLSFAFDCLAAGGAAQGTWLCHHHATLHRRTRAFQQWMQSRFSCCSTEFVHVPGHRGDPWNEAADAVCWATLHGWISGFDFDWLLRATQLTPFDDVVEWLWFWQRARDGVVGYPRIQEGAFCFTFEHRDVPETDASAHTLTQVQDALH